MSDRPRIVVDTNALISRLLLPASVAGRAVRRAIEEGQLLVSEAGMLELAEVLSRAKFKTKISGLGFSPGQFFDSYAKRAEVVQAMSVPRLAPDPGDDAVIGTALAAKADLVVTGDRTLLSVAEYEGVRIVSVGEAMKAVARQSV